MDRRALLWGGAISMLLPAERSAADASVSLTGRVQGGGLVRGVTEPGALVQANGQTFHADSQGQFVFGVPRDTFGLLSVQVATTGGTAVGSVAVTRREYRTTVVDNLPGAAETGDFLEVGEDALAETGAPAAQVGASTLNSALIAVQNEKKKAAWLAETRAVRGYVGAFHKPLSRWSVKSDWGGNRIKRHRSGRVDQAIHYGVDLAAAAGDPITAPADGEVVLVGLKFYYEGNCVFLAHGQGLVTAYLHMSQVAVSLGQIVRQGDLLGAVGSTGMATGPHLCWRAKCRNVQIDPALLV